MIWIEGALGDHVRVIGALLGPQLRMLLEALEGIGIGLDLSAVSEADVDAVRMLARLPQEQCRLLACPRWLALSIERERQARPPAVAHA